MLGKTPKLQHSHVFAWGPAKLGVTWGALGGVGWLPSTCPVPGTSHLLAPSWTCAAHFLSASWENVGKNNTLSGYLYFLAAWGSCSSPDTSRPCMEGLSSAHLPLNTGQRAAWEGADVNSPFST